MGIFAETEKIHLEVHMESQATSTASHKKTKTARGAQSGQNQRESVQAVARGSGKGRAWRSCEMGRDFQIYKVKSVTGVDGGDDRATVPMDVTPLKRALKNGQNDTLRYMYFSIIINAKRKATRSRVMVPSCCLHVKHACHRGGKKTSSPYARTTRCRDSHVHLDKDRMSATQPFAPSRHSHW